MRKYVLPFIFGAVAALIVWGVAGLIVRHLPIDDALKGGLILVTALATFVLVNGYSASKLGKKTLP